MRCKGCVRIDLNVALKCMVVMFLGNKEVLQGECIILLQRLHNFLAYVTVMTHNDASKDIGQSLPPTSI